MYSNSNVIKVDTFGVEDYRLSTKIKFKNKGDNYIRGYFIEDSYKLTENVKDTSEINVNQSQIKTYFKKRVFVTDK
jgi:hypothetical protein